MSVFSERLKKCLDDKGISAYRMSKDTGISERLIRYWLSGDKVPGSDNLSKVTEYLDRSADYLLGREEDPPEKYEGSMQYAAFEGLEDLTDEDRAEVEEFIRFKVAQRRKEKKV